MANRISDDFLCAFYITFLHSKGHTNFFAGAPLNRLAWLRTSPAFLNAVVLSPATRWVLFNDGKSALARLSTKDVRPLLGPEPFFSQGQHAGEIAEGSVKELEASRLHGPPVVFLGLHEHEDSTGSASRALPSSDFSAKKDAEAVVAKIHGTPYFSLDVSNVEQTRVDEVLGSSEAGKSGAVLEFFDGRAAMNMIDQFDSGVFSVARTLVDWSARNKVYLTNYKSTAVAVCVGKG